MELNLSSYATKTDLKNVTHVDVSSFTSKANLTNLKTEVDKLDIDKLRPVPNDLAKLSNAVKNDIVKKIEYNKLVTNNIDTTRFVLKTTYDTDKSDLEKKISNVDKKIPNISGLATKSALTAVENKIPHISGLATNLALTGVENKIPDVSGLATNLSLTAVENKIPTVSGLVTKADFEAGLKKISDRVTSNKTKHLLAENELITFDSSYFKGKSHFKEDGTQIYLVFQPIYRYFKRLQVLVGVIIYTSGNLKVCLMKGLTLILHLMTPLPQN